jgi:hypothetical protein
MATTLGQRVAARLVAGGMADVVTEVDQEALLQADEALPGAQRTVDRQDRYVVPPPEAPAWTLDQHGCAAYPALGIDSFERGLNGASAQFVREPRSIIEEIERYPSGVAQQVMSDARRVAPACSQYQPPGLPFTVGLAMRSTGFAGDDSLLVEFSTVGEKNQSVYFVLIRVGDLIATIIVRPDLWQPAMGATAAQRLCSTTTAC